ncbi:MAG: UDP-glucose 4-epimerase GalE [Bacilli bacterium]|jgi:UDP-glucose 4-epimerase|nr:UDP-glucose 4-epimerase GalE [Bacilli bacterium]
MKTILVTGGTGFIGSHTCVELLNDNYNIVIIDDFSNSKPEVAEKIMKITNKKVKLYEGNVCDTEFLTKIFKENQIDAVIHFAGYKAVGESVAKPLMYYRNNIDSTLTLLEVMSDNNCKKIVFSSSATVYGNPERLPLDESCHLSATNPYGATKLYIEGILKDLYISDNEWSIAILRYFNPVGAHESGLIGENPNGIPNNLVPYIVKVANKELPELNIFGNDYNTPDGTGVRDYIHVVDLARGHVKSVEKIFQETGIDYYNLGTGKGYSVLDLVKTFESVNNIKIPYKIVARRKGDVAACFASTNHAKEKLNWEATLTLEDMLRSAYLYSKVIKKGY